ncbi:tetratricopeptide repeat protein [Vulgatibacter incomptus]|uniref:Uncharacterized protein n=1 Tax=Vulgatibacter incomptus TaxID=1391653 RepID=A0A0K1PA23_9BACT|nr:tetratricopeptide repeat protein [Vulgatibacter incomptus]AKU90365.1 hypothetical protein AKJ08_0752 [Vulgatibacter incomptus]
MINLGISILIGLVAFAVFAVIFSPFAAIVPFVIAFLAAYIVLTNRAMKQVGAISAQAQKEMQAQRFDKAIETFKRGFALEKRQLLVGPLMHANLGTLLYAKGDFAAARPHLEKSNRWGPVTRTMLGANYAVLRAMLACDHFRNRKYDEMRATFETAVKQGKKDGLIWSLYAYCLSKIGDREGAMKVLGRAADANPNDEKIKANQLALQNNKRMKMKAYTPQFYQFHIEPPPPEMGGAGRRVVWQRR